MKPRTKDNNPVRIVSVDQEAKRQEGLPDCRQTVLSASVLLRNVGSYFCGGGVYCS